MRRVGGARRRSFLRGQFGLRDILRVRGVHVSISWHCECGRSLKAPDTAAGKRARCPACQKVNQVPFPEPFPEPVAVAEPPLIESGDAPDDEYELAAPAPVAKPARRVTIAQPVVSDDAVTPAPYYRKPEINPMLSGREADDDGDDDEGDGEPTGRTWRDFCYLVLLLALVPLIVSSLGGNHATFFDLVDRNLESHPEVAETLQAELKNIKDLTDVANFFPGHHLDGALLARGSMAHWLFALISAACFLTLTMFLFRRGSAKPKSLLLTGLFTGTVGIFLLIAFQFVAHFTQGWWLRGSSIIVLLFYVVKFIGFSYYAADDPTNGFAASFFGYTFGVGLCEEVCKALPLIVMIQNLPKRATWRTACLWGLASGVGFGVAEGIMYSGRYYNGIQGGEAYLVRFVSCVALHSIWAAAVAIGLFKFRNEITNAESAGGMLFTTAVIAMPSIILHGLYDTLLKKDFQVYALLIALASFVYLVCLIEWSQLKPDDGDVPRGRLARA